MSKGKLTHYFKPGNNKIVRKDVDSTVQNEPIIKTTTSQDKEAVTMEEESLKKDNVLARTIGSNNSNGCIMMSSKWI